MSVKYNYEIIIIGSGPAGTSLAYDLASTGVSTLIIEKEKFPRYKCCGGGVTFKAAKLLAPEIHEVFESTVQGVRIAFPGDPIFVRTSEQPLVYMVMRNKFDQALLRQAKTAGAVVVQGNPVEKIDLKEDGVEVVAGQNTYRSRFVIGADGVNSITAKALGIKNTRSRIIAIESEIKVPVKELARWESQLLLELGRVSGGYAWVFPKADHLSIGIGCLEHTVLNLKRLFFDFIASLGLESYTIERFGSAFIPVCNEGKAVCKGRAALVGDAAGLSDPLTGEGIYNAILSSRLAASVLKNALLINQSDLTEYDILVKEEIASEMKVANSFFNSMTRSPHKFYELIQNRDTVWKNCCDLLRGNRMYSDVKGFSRVVVVD